MITPAYAAVLGLHWINSPRMPGIAADSDKVRVSPPGTVFVCPLPRIAQDVGVVRTRARAVLDCLGLQPDSAADVLLVVSELVTNAVTHALPPAVLRLSWTHRRRSLRIEVADGGPSPRHRDRRDRPSDESGRGMTIVAAVANRYRVITRPDGVTRWAEVSVT
ncbi:ATP-binding protein [Streptomyces sp. KR55]|uniref:ATP-binding protein n=1 Tax=Streptomyces sp. KR55 TaxID=3457425 RepID=UPI003FD3043E